MSESKELKVKKFLKDFINEGFVETNDLGFGGQEEMFCTYCKAEIYGIGELKCKHKKSCLYDRAVKLLEKEK